ncbi:MAG: DUF4381 domain-containing protein [Deltaproteobacteria bacterium]|nr:DUF4381 domain-containing protein [Deltaproteobacteria bacterium]
MSDRAMDPTAGSAAAAASVPAPAAAAADAAPAAAAATQSSLARATTTSGTAATDPLAELRGIHLPEPVGFWPPAPGWWGLAAIVVAATAATVVAVRRRRRSVVRHALRELDGLARESSETDLQTLATTLSALVRRVALLRFGRARVASLHGAAWQHFLAETAPKARRRRTRFAEDARLVLSVAPYAPAGAHALARDGRTVDRATLIAATRAWIEENA